MKKVIPFSLFMIITSFFLTSCEGDCNDVEIETVEWVTDYVDKSKDTLVSYSILKDEREYFSSFKEIKHTVTIKNNNQKFSNQFSLKIEYGEVDYWGDDVEKEKTLDYVSIEPNGSYTFTYYTQAGKYANYNSSYTILQKPIQYYYKERQDHLKTSTKTVNTCEENVEALRMKYEAIREAYNEKAKLKEIVLSSDYGSRKMPRNDAKEKAKPKSDAKKKAQQAKPSMKK